LSLYQYRKEKISKQYGESIFVAQGKGMKEILTVREKNFSIFRDYYNSPQTAAKPIKSDITTTAAQFRDAYLRN